MREKDERQAELNALREELRRFSIKYEELREDVRRLTNERNAITDEANLKLDEAEWHIKERDGLIQKKNDELEKAKSLIEELEKEIARLLNELAALMATPYNFGAILDYGGEVVVDVKTPEGLIKIKVDTYLVFRGASLVQSAIPKDLMEKEKDRLVRGRFVTLNGNSDIIAVADDKLQEILALVGEVATVDEIINDKQVIISTRLEEKREVLIPETLAKEITKKIRIGDKWLIPNVAPAFIGGKEALPKQEIGNLLVEEAPAVKYSDIGGLGPQIELIREAIEMPFLHSALYHEFNLTAPRGVLLYGAPGCGKTMIAQAVAWSLGEELSKRFNRPLKGYFYKIDGPEVLNKFVGETERTIREIFQKAREKANEDHPVVIFFDEADSLLRTRGSGISSDVEMTTVAQFLAEIQGLEKLKNVIVILASNRQDLIDPAVLRPGRIDVKIEVKRPDKEGAKEIFGKYITADLPIHPKYLDEKHPKFENKYKELNGDRQKIVEYFIIEVTRRLWATEEEPFEYKTLEGEEINIVKADNRIMEFIPQGGQKVTLYLKDLTSGAMIKNIVDTGKKNSIKRFLYGDEKGLTTYDLCIAVGQEKEQNENLPNTAAGAEQWLRQQGFNVNVVHAKSFANEKTGKDKEKPKKVETIEGTGHYL